MVHQHSVVSNTESIYNYDTDDADEDHRKPEVVTSCNVEEAYDLHRD